MEAQLRTPFKPLNKYDRAVMYGGFQEDPRETLVCQTTTRLIAVENICIYNIYISSYIYIIDIIIDIIYFQFAHIEFHKRNIVLMMIKYHFCGINL